MDHSRPHPNAARTGLRLALLLALATALALMTSLVAGGAPAHAAQCKNASKPAYSMPAKKASRITLCLLNKERRSRGMGRLKADGQQKKAAKKHNRAMIKRNCFDHTCPGEKDLVRRILSVGYLPCNCTWGVGENIAYGYRKQSSPRRIVAAWMASPPHKSNILNRSFEHIGIGVIDKVPGSKTAGATYTTDFGFKH